MTVGDRDRIVRDRVVLGAAHDRHPARAELIGLAPVENQPGRSGQTVTRVSGASSWIRSDQGGSSTDLQQEGAVGPGTVQADW